MPPQIISFCWVHTSIHLLNSNSAPYTNISATLEMKPRTLEQQPSASVHVYARMAISLCIDCTGYEERVVDFNEKKGLLEQVIDELDAVSSAVDEVDVTA